MIHLNSFVAFSEVTEDMFTQIFGKPEDYGDAGKEWTLKNMIACFDPSIEPADPHMQLAGSFDGDYYLSSASIQHFCDFFGLEFPKVEMMDAEFAYYAYVRSSRKKATREQIKWATYRIAVLNDLEAILRSRLVSVHVKFVYDLICVSRYVDEILIGFR
jgi:hypothetical protein